MADLTPTAPRRTCSLSALTEGECNPDNIPVVIFVMCVSACVTFTQRVCGCSFPLKHALINIHLAALHESMLYPNLCWRFVRLCRPLVVPGMRPRQATTRAQRKAAPLGLRKKRTKMTRRRSTKKRRETRTWREKVTGRRSSLREPRRLIRRMTRKVQKGRGAERGQSQEHAFLSVGATFSSVCLCFECETAGRSGICCRYSTRIQGWWT